MQLRGAIASHVGNVRDTNQDRAHFGAYVAAVADGMGGHQGGEMAASIAIKEFVEVNDPIVPGGLADIVEEANRAVFERAADPDLRGMGTTLVALTLRPEEGTISVVNVGDSRAYFLRGDAFNQLTLDHSLVEDLVRQNRLTPEEALTHPQRNILTRALGIASEVEVDRFLHDAELGDRFLLCSDGLFNEVTEVEITRILMEYVEPNDAADSLVSAALAGAARDNVTVAVVDVVTDGDGGNVSSTSAETLQVPVVPMTANDDTLEAEDLLAEAGKVADADPDYDEEDLDFGDEAAGQGAGEPIVQSAGMTQAGAVAGGVGLDLAEPDLAVAEDPAYSDSLGSVDTIELPPVESSRHGSRVRQVLFGVFILAALAGAVYYAVNSYANNKWYVAQTADTGEIAIFNGRPGGFLWVEPTLEDRIEGVFYAELTAENKIRVDEQELFDSLEGAEAFVESLTMKPEEALEQIEQNDGSDPGTETDPDQPADSTDTGSTDTSAAQLPSPTTVAPTTTTVG